MFGDVLNYFKRTTKKTPKDYLFNSVRNTPEAHDLYCSLVYTFCASLFVGKERSLFDIQYIEAFREVQVFLEQLIFFKHPPYY